VSQHPRPVGPAQQNNAATFSPEMAQGQRPPERRRVDVARHRQGQWSGELTTIIVTPFTIEMTFATYPVAPRPHKPTKGPSFFPFSGTAAVDTPSMWAGSLPTTSRQRPIPNEGWFASTDVPSFAFESTYGWHPDAPRLFVKPKVGWSVSQPTHVNAPFTPDMADGWLPEKSRYAAPSHQGVQWVTPEVLDFSIETIVGSRPDRPRLMLGPKINLPVSQTTPVSAPFTPDMVIGNRPDRSRYSAPLHQGVQWVTVDVSDFSIEMLFATRPERPRLTAGNQTGATQSQPTHTNAPFGFEMAQGQRPVERSHAYVHAHHGWWINQAVEVPLVVYVVSTGSHSTSEGTFRTSSDGSLRSTT
jgi:hypothetical protein